MEPGSGKFVVEMNKDQDVRSQLAKIVVDQGWGLLEMAGRELSLEEIFVQLVTEEPGGEG
jgi:ABC-2 type transport system ATP-binding protein